MIASLRGKLLHKDAQGIVLECGGVGYGLSMSLSSLTQLPEIGGEASIMVHTHLSQDSLRLYGFVSAEERRAFEVLVGTSGVGPRLALAILSALSPAELGDAVLRADKGTLRRIPGVGPKKAERLLLELKGRLDAMVVPEGAVNRNGLQSDLVSALAHIGFSPAVAEKAAQHAVDSLPDERNVSVLVREALRAATRL